MKRGWTRSAWLAEYADVPLVQLLGAIHSEKLSVATEPTTAYLAQVTDLEAWCREELGRPPRAGPGR